jgi:hypothetical protein
MVEVMGRSVSSERWEAVGARVRRPIRLSMSSICSKV